MILHDRIHCVGVTLEGLHRNEHLDVGLGGLQVLERRLGKVAVRLDETVDRRAFDRPIVDGGRAFHLDLAAGRLRLVANGLSGCRRCEQQSRRAAGNRSDS